MTIYKIMDMIVNELSEVNKHKLFRMFADELGVQLPEESNIIQLFTDEGPQVVSRQTFERVLDFIPNKLMAVKWYKDQFNVGLKEAKHICDAIFEYRFSK